jgi:hypothetical protein
VRPMLVHYLAIINTLRNPKSRKYDLENDNDSSGGKSLESRHRPTLELNTSTLGSHRPCANPHFSIFPQVGSGIPSSE